jgi:hypothetical protein
MRGAPESVGRRHVRDQAAECRIDGSPTRAVPARAPCPASTEPVAMPSEHGVWPDQDQADRQRSQALAKSTQNMRSRARRSGRVTLCCSVRNGLGAQHSRGSVPDARGRRGRSLARSTKKHSSTTLIVASALRQINMCSERHFGERQVGRAPHAAPLVMPTSARLLFRSAS